MKKCFNILLVLFVVLFVGIIKVNAAALTLTQTDFTDAKSTPGVETAKGLKYYEDEIAGGDHIKYYLLPSDTDVILDGDINLDDGAGIIQLRNNNVTLNSNVVLNGSFKTESLTNNTIDGSGTVSGGFAQYGGTATINGSITFNDIIISYNANSTIINGGTFNKGLSGKSNTTVTINAGTFKSSDTGICAVISDGYSEFTINGGTFDGSFIGFSNEVGDTLIKGGTFTGGTAGAFIGSDNTKISGGTFKSTGTRYLYGDGKQGAIVITDTITFADILSNGYQYSTSTESTTVDPYQILLLNTTEITVSKIPTEEPAEQSEATTTTEETKDTTKNPNTSDNIITYISVLGISIIGIVGINLYNKRFN